MCLLKLLKGGSPYGDNLSKDHHPTANIRIIAHVAKGFDTQMSICSLTKADSGEGERVYRRATGQLPVTISDLTVDPGSYDAMREGVTLQWRPATLAVKAFRRHRGLLMRIYED